VTVLALEGPVYLEHAAAVGQGTVTSKLLDGLQVDVAALFAAGKQ
jgi:hypothetical protein